MLTWNPSADFVPVQPVWIATILTWMTVIDDSDRLCILLYISRGLHATLTWAVTNSLCTLCTFWGFWDVDMNVYNWFSILFAASVAYMIWFMTQHKFKECIKVWRCNKHMYINTLLPPCTAHHFFSHPLPGASFFCAHRSMLKTNPKKADNLCTVGCYSLPFLRKVCFLQWLSPVRVHHLRCL